MIQGISGALVKTAAACSAYLQCAAAFVYDKEKK
jgi:hypothetical protein